MEGPFDSGGVQGLSDLVPYPVQYVLHAWNFPRSSVPARRTRSLHLRNMFGKMYVLLNLCNGVSVRYFLSEYLILNIVPLYLALLYS